ncbi:AsnC family transcriptional regulator [Nocardioides sp. CF8]|uniref:Lrp/AsnC family transcriptional regulator n=1 Tax=Nocardioides sp. CF8 TaxID=110319 RepID=UPI00032EF6C5|nr:Lrp/AsnC family transcriptional regulator [Nocardioides sp. CF8]EON22479.1 AsnC family transcriptional regulator [Nocardioides sp. CF8]
MPRPIPATEHAALDAVDLRILSELTEDGRVTNSALAARVGIAESTCLARVRSLRERDIVRGIHADVDLATLGFPIQAVIKVRLGSHNRDHVATFHRALPAIPGVVRILHVGGEDDYLLQVAVASTQQLRDLVLEHINVHPIVRHTETQIVFEEMVGAGVL